MTLPVRLLALAALFLVSGAALAQGFPSRPLTLVVPFAPGAANDVLARTLAAEMKDAFGTVVVDNKPGGNGVIGAEFVKRAAPDGHTLLVAPSQFVILAAISRSLPFDFVRDFEPIVLATNLPFLLVVNEEALPAKSLLEMIEMARRQPGKLSYGSAGNGSPHHLATEMLKLQSGIDAVHVPYKGMALGIPDLLTGRIQFVITGFPAVASHMKTGKLKVLATVGSARSSFHPEAPTFAEAGVPGVEMDTWLGLLAPAATPRATIQRLNAELNRVLKLPRTREKLAAQGLEALGGTPEAFSKRIRDDLAALVRLVKTANIKLD